MSWGGGRSDRICYHETVSILGGGGGSQTFPESIHARLESFRAWRGQSQLNGKYRQKTRHIN